MTIAVNAVPPRFREYKFPRSPTAIAPMQDTTSDRLKMNMFAILFAAYAEQEMITMTTISHDQSGCRFDSDEKTEKIGTMMNWDHQGNGCKYQGASGGR